LGETIAVVSNTCWSLYNFRFNLMRALKQEGWNVIAMAPADGYEEEISREFTYVPTKNINRRANSVLQDLLLFREYTRSYAESKPEVVLNFTIKPNIYSTLAARLNGADAICSVTGLGTSFGRRNLVFHVVLFLYRLAFRFARRVIFQNRDDLREFLQWRIVREKKTLLTPGSGVDIERFSLSEHERMPSEKEGVRFIYFGRMLKEKGVLDYIEAARTVKKRYGSAQFALLGPVEADSRSGIALDDIQSWVEEGIVSYLGAAKDVLPFLRDCDVVVLPSYYREGIPRSLLEAQALGKPIITTDSTGCREAVTHGVNGLLVPPKSAHMLSEAMLRMIEMGPEKRNVMGRRGRAKVEKEYDERIVIQQYLGALGERAVD
jgi:glycosyltransferase involved in cell wall biosynthesis